VYSRTKDESKLQYVYSLPADSMLPSQLSLKREGGRAEGRREKGREGRREGGRRAEGRREEEGATGTEHPTAVTDGSNGDPSRV
jgi:hypothetical protein